MGPPAAPGAHPENQQAAQWTASRGDQEPPPYVIMGGPEAAPAAASARRTDKDKDSPMEHILDFFNVWSRKAEELSSNIWLNRKHKPSIQPPFLFFIIMAMLCFGSHSHPSVLLLFQ
jgi:hypothetical protein